MKTVLYIDGDGTVTILEGTEESHNEAYNDDVGNWVNPDGYSIINGFDRRFRIDENNGVLFMIVSPKANYIIDIALGYEPNIPYQLELKNPQDFIEKLKSLYELEEQGKLL